MKKKSGMKVLVFLFCLVIAAALSSCDSKSGNTIDEPEITGKYLTEEYAEQILNDGAETVVGFVSMEKEGEDSYLLEIKEQEIVPSSKYDSGYYIADRNVTKEVPLGFDGRIACFHDGEYVVETPDEFISEHGDSSDQLFTVYLMGDSAELLVYTDPKDAIEK